MFIASVITNGLTTVLYHDFWLNMWENPFPHFVEGKKSCLLPKSAKGLARDALADDGKISVMVETLLTLPGLGAV